MVNEGKTKKGQTKKKRRERRQEGTGAQLVDHTCHLLREYMLHRRVMILQYHVLRERSRHSFCMWVDYSARISIMEIFHTQSGEMCPQEIGCFIAVITRDWQEGYDSAETILNDDGRVEEHQVVFFDFNSGGSTGADLGSIANQGAVTTEACMQIILLLHYVRKGYKFTYGQIVFISDNCTDQLKCASHFAALDSWVNHFKNLAAQSASADDITSTSRTPAEDLAKAAHVRATVAAAAAEMSDEEVAEEFKTDVATICFLKLKMGVTQFVKLLGAAMHGKYKGDGISLNIRVQADRMTLLWSIAGDISPERVEGAKQLQDRMNEVNGGMRRFVKNERAEQRPSVKPTTDGIYYHMLYPEFWEQTRRTVLTYPRVKAAKGEGSSTWQEARFETGWPLQPRARDTGCECVGCRQLEKPPLWQADARLALAKWLHPRLNSERNGVAAAAALGGSTGVAAVLAAVAGVMAKRNLCTQDYAPPFRTYKLEMKAATTLAAAATDLNCPVDDDSNPADLAEQRLARLENWQLHAEAALTQDGADRICAFVCVDEAGCVDESYIFLHLTANLTELPIDDSLLASSGDPMPAGTLVCAGRRLRPHQETPRTYLEEKGAESRLPFCRGRCRCIDIDAKDNMIFSAETGHWTVPEQQHELLMAIVEGMNERQEQREAEDAEDEEEQEQAAAQEEVDEQREGEEEGEEEEEEEEEEQEEQEEEQAEETVKCLQLGDMPAESNVLAFVSLQGSRTIELGEIDRQHFEVRGEKENVRVLPLPRPRQSGVGGGGGVEVQTEFLPVRRADPKLVPCERVLQGWEATKGVGDFARPMVKPYRTFPSAVTISQ